MHLFATVFFLMTAYYTLKPVREALILSEGDAETRAYTQGAVALTLIFLLPLYKQLFEGLADSESRSRVLRWVIAFFISNLLVFYFMGRGGLAIGVPFFIWLSIFNVTVIAQFWAFSADLYNTRSGQRLFVVIMVGAASGALVGAQTEKVLIAIIGQWELMLVASAILSIPIGLSVLAERSVPKGSENLHREPLGDGRFTVEDLIGGFDVVFRSRYLISLAVLMVLINYINTTGEYILAWFVDRHAQELAESGVNEAEYIGAFYGDYLAWVTLIGLALQLLVVSRLFRTAGVRGAVLVLPVLLIINYAALLVLPVFALVRVLMITEKSVYNSLQNTTNQALYLPLKREQKYVGKTTIDTFFVRSADFVYAGVVFVLIEQAGLGVRTIMSINFVLAIVALVVAWDIRRRHGDVVQKNVGNLPPQIVTPLPDVYVPSGELLMFSVPEKCFMDPDPGDTLEYEACLENGEPLPKWIRFDRRNQTFTVKPPPGTEGQLTVELVARDFQGLSVKASFVLEHGPEGSPRFLPVPVGPES